MMNYDRWSERYDIFYANGPEGEVEFYLDMLDEYGGPVLEIGVGTGRIAIPAVNRGHQVTGIDLNEPMLQRARSKRTLARVAPGQLQLIKADMTDFALPGRRFPIVIIPANTLTLALSESAQRAALKRAAAHMTRDGVLIFNIYNPTEDMINDQTEEEFLIGVVDDDGSGLRHVLTGINRFDNSLQVNRCTQIIETLMPNGDTVDREELSVVTRYLHHHQVVNMLECVGLRAVETYGDFDMSPLNAESEELIYVCKRSSAQRVEH